MNFNQLQIKKGLQKSLEELSFVNLTPIQEKVIPLLLNSTQDIIALAQTGTGKTAAFGVPIIEKVTLSKKNVQSIILSPTRELCLQITKDLKSYSKYIEKLKITAVYGGANINTQIKSLDTGTHIVVGTPGRVLDLIKRKKLFLSDIEFLVLDEADEMLNMGFKKDLNKILEKTPKKKQSLLFSATMPKEILAITKNHLEKGKIIEVAKRNEGAKNIEHHLYLVSIRDKYNVLRNVCNMYPSIYAIIFCRTRRETKNISDKLVKDGYNADFLNGDLSQNQRDNVMDRFRNKNISILVATDVAARGIDIDNLTHVVNYSLPDDPEIYIHRSGRTGRKDKKGISIIISHAGEKRKISKIEKISNKKFLKKDVPSFKDIYDTQLLNITSKILNTQINQNIEQYLPKIVQDLSHLKKEELISRFISFELSKFQFGFKGKEHKKSDYKKKISSSKKNLQYKLQMGKKDGITPKIIIKLLNQFSGKKNNQLGNIEIHKKHTIFESGDIKDKDMKKIIYNAEKNDVCIIKHSI